MLPLLYYYFWEIVIFYNQLPFYLYKVEIKQQINENKLSSLWYNSFMDKKYEKISQDLGVTLKQIDTVLSLTAEGATIPFIARYRKDMTGSLDEVAIKAIIDLDKSLTALNDRKEAVLAKIKEQGKLTKELEEAILSAEKLADVEELYLPYKEKRRTKATIAREA